MEILKQLPPMAVLSAYLAFLLMLGELLVRGKNLKNYLLAALFASLGTVLMHGHWIESLKIIQIPHIYQTHLFFVFCIGPLLYLYFQLQLREETRLPARYWWHFAPAVLALLVMLPLYFEDEASKLARVQRIWSLGGPAAFSDYGLLLFLAGLIHICAYALITPARFLQGFRARTLLTESSMRIVLSFCGLGLLLTGMVIVGVIQRNRTLIQLSVDGLALVIPFVYVMTRRYPAFFHDLVLYQKQEKYRQTQLKGLDLDRVDDRLETLMREENLHRDDELTLAGLAARLEITTHQLSEYFNNHRKVNFAGYINGKRIDEASELLKQDAKRTVLSIAYDVGFNSKSAFNRAFIRHTGMSPTEFRKRNGER